MRTSNKRLVYNTITYIISYGATLVISFILTPYLIRTFGKETYSFYTIANNLTAYMMVVCNALNTIACRYIAIEINKRNFKKANDYYKSVFIANIVLSAMMSILMIVIVIFLEKFFQVPLGYVSDIKLLFALTFMSMIVNVIASIFSIATVACDRMDLRAYREISTSILKLVFIYGLFMLFNPRISFVGLVALLIAFINGLIQFGYTRRLTPELKVKDGTFSFASVKEIVSVGIWNTLNSLGGQLLTGLTIILVNAWISATDASYLSIVHTPVGLLNGVITALVTALYPRMLKTYSQSQELFAKTTFTFQKVLATFTNVTVAGIAVMGQAFYQLWVPEVNSEILSFVTIIQIFSIFIIGNVHLYMNANTLTLKIKVPALMLCSLALANILGTFAMTHWYNASFTAVIIFNCALTTLYYLVFIPIYSYRNTGLSLKKIYLNILTSAVVVAALVGLGQLINTVWVVNSWLMFFIKTAVVGLAFLLINGLVMLRSEILGRWKNRKNAPSS